MSRWRSANGGRVSRGACHIPSAWAEYRQALRTLPETITDSASIVWPVAPSPKDPPHARGQCGAGRGRGL
ncbi:phage tail assembly chaperone [Novosphingobium pituita]|uniref:phage tail assembly chaperone n=1 Tax=Novosphingobium pituita TaxID=3056842 RepID=UPI00295EB6BA|nr:phage tail assembly chaperone [Novosphingobium sp. IK01]